MAEKGFQVDAVDICALAIERAQTLPNSNLVNWVQADLLDNDLFKTVLQAESYDFVFDMQCFHVLRAINETRAADIIATALKPGGYALVVVGAVDPSRDSGDSRYDGVDKPGPPRLTMEELRGPLQSAGLTPVQLYLSRFGPTDAYQHGPASALSPLAWVGLFQRIPWAPQLRRYALEVQAPYSTYILDGQKTIETRAYPLSACLLHQPILLLQPATGQDAVSSLPSYIPAHSTVGRIVGTVTFSACTQYASQADWESDRAQHLVPAHSAYDWRDCAVLTESNTERAFTDLSEGKLSELWGWQVAAVERISTVEAGALPALCRVHRSLFVVES